MVLLALPPPAADTVGLAKTGEVPADPRQAYGEDRYRMSPLIQHPIFAGKAFHD